MAKKKEIEIAVADVVDFMRMTGSFAPALQKVIQRKVTADEARKQKVRVTARELQKAADAFRVTNGLHKAKDTQRWLAANGVSIEAMEEFLETNILIEKFKDKLEKKAAKSKYLKAPGIRNSIREMVYNEWAAKALK